MVAHFGETKWVVKCYELPCDEVISDMDHMTSTAYCDSSQSPGDEVYLFKLKLKKHFVPLVFSCFCIAVIITTRCCVPLVLVLCCRVALFFNVFKSGASMSLRSVYLKRANPSG